MEACRAQFVWHASCTEVQPNVQDGFTVAFSMGAGKGMAVLAEARLLAVSPGGAGTKQPAWQFATCELHNIMQLVTVEVTGVESPDREGDTCWVEVVACANTTSCALHEIAAAATRIGIARRRIISSWVQLHSPSPARHQSRWGQFCSCCGGRSNPGSFKDRKTESVFNGECPKGFPASLLKVATATDRYEGEGAAEYRLPKPVCTQCNHYESLIFYARNDCTPEAFVLRATPQYVRSGKARCRRLEAAMAVTTEIAPNIYRISIFAQRGNFQFNHFLVKDDEPLLFQLRGR
jgi:hypothetical protein